MACEFICDGCGKREPAERREKGCGKPWMWYQRTQPETGKVFDACCRECIEQINRETGDPAPVMPW